MNTQNVARALAARRQRKRKPYLSGDGIPRKGSVARSINEGSHDPVTGAQKVTKRY